MRVVVGAKQGAPGTSVMGFRIPPNEGVWRPGPMAPTRTMIVVGTEERSFCRPLDGRARMLDWMTAVLDRVG